MSTSSDALARAQQRHEKWISAFVAFATGSAILTVGGTWAVGMMPDGRIALAVVAFCGLMTVYYAYCYTIAGDHLRSERSRAIHGTLEVTAVTAALLLDTAVSREFGLLGPAPVVYPLAILLGSLRLLPKLSLWQGVYAAGSYMLIYVWQQGWTSTEPAMLPALHAYKGMTILLTGMLAYLVSRSLRSLLIDSVKAAEQKTRLQGALGFYVPEQLVERVMSGDLTLRTERRAISVMFVDIRGFTTLSETTDPVELLDKLNKALDGFSLQVQKHDGIVNKFLGDGLMALFGAPVGSDEHARQAARAALGIEQIAADLRESGAFPELFIGVGVHCGEVVVGDVGGASRREYTAIGDVVNVAARVEGTNKQLGTNILLTAAAAEAIGEDWNLVEKEAVKLKGREEPVVLWELRA